MWSLVIAGAAIASLWTSRERQEGKIRTAAAVDNLAKLTGGRPPMPTSITSQNIGQAGVAPEGFRIFSKTPVPDSVTLKCKTLLSRSFGYEEYAELEGKRYFFRIEPHYHPPGYSGYQGAPIGWHKGCTVYEALEIIV